MVESGGLENRWACKRLVGSNPTLSAKVAPVCRGARVLRPDDYAPVEPDVEPDGLAGSGSAGLTMAWQATSPTWRSSVGEPGDLTD